VTQSVLITGGASGIGAAVARRVVEGGGWVCLVDVNEQGVIELARELLGGIDAVRHFEKWKSPDEREPPLVEEEGD